MQLLTPYYETYDPVQLRHFALHGEPPSEEAATYATGAGEPQLHPSVPIPYPPAAPAPHHAHPHPPMLIESNLRFNNLRAAVPLREGDWSYVDTTSLRPMVSYINAHATFLPLAYRLALPVVRILSIGLPFSLATPGGQGGGGLPHGQTPPPGHFSHAHMSHD